MKSHLFFKNKDYCYYLFAIAIGLLLWFFENQITDALEKTAVVVSNCKEIPFVIIIIVLSVGLSFYCLFKIFGKKKEYVSHRQIAFLLLVAAVYAYYRYRKESPFEFWGFSLGDYNVGWTDFLYLPLALRVLQAVFYKTPTTDKENESVLLSDNAITTPQDDLFGYDDYVSDLLSDINSLDLSESYSIGITGDWGQGKSSFLNLLKEKVEEQKDLFVEFSPRNSKNVTTIQEDFFKQLNITLSKHHTDLKKSFRRYTKALSVVHTGWLGKLFSVVDVLDAGDEKKAINNAIQRIGKRLFIIIEDFDRLTAEEILEVLKVIDRNGDFRSTVYLAAYDKRYINSVLTKYFKNDNTQDYSDKYFQYEFSLPAQQSTVIIDFITEHLESVSEIREKVSKERIDKYLKSNRKIIAACLPSLRHAKRFLNIFCSRYPKIKEDVFFTDFFILTLLRYVDINAYYALARLKLVAPGNYVNYQSKMYTLIYNIDNVLEEISRHKQSRTLLGLLFSKDDIECVDSQPINRIRWINSFDLYFYDYRPDRAYYKDLLQLFQESEDKDAYKILDEGLDKGQGTDIEDFLSSRNADWISNADRFSRLIKLLCYLNHKEGRSVALESEISSFLEVQTANKYASYLSKDEYKRTVEKSFREALIFSPVELGLLFIREIDNINEDHNYNKALLFSQKELIGFAIWTQKYYYRLYENPDFNYGFAFILANIKTKQNVLTQVIKPAKQELVSMMKLHPEDFARNIMVLRMIDNNNGKYLQLSFNENFLADRYFPVDGFSFNDWVALLPDEYAQNVLKAIHSCYMDGKKVIQVEALQDEYEESDFKSIYEAIVKDSILRLDMSVRDAINDEAVYDLSCLKEKTSAKDDEIRSSISRLVNEKTVDTKYLYLKDKIVPFIEGDFIQVKRGVFIYSKKYQSGNLNLFRIIKIHDDGQYELSGWEILFSKQDLRPVFIDDEVSQHIYYDPVVAASTIGLRESISPHRTNYDYFMKYFENCFDHEEVSFKERIEQKGFLFVHEVQHWLRKEFGSDNLKIR